MKMESDKITIHVLANYMLSHDERGIWHCSRMQFKEDGEPDLETISEEVDFFDLIRDLHTEHLRNHREFFKNMKDQDDEAFPEEETDQRGRPL